MAGSVISKLACTLRPGTVGPSLLLLPSFLLLLARVLRARGRIAQMKWRAGDLAKERYTRPSPIPGLSRSSAFSNLEDRCIETASRCNKVLREQTVRGRKEKGKMARDVLRRGKYNDFSINIVLKHLLFNIYKIDAKIMLSLFLALSLVYAVHLHTQPRNSNSPGSRYTGISSPRLRIRDEQSA